ncbi:MAG: putative toxin-antitoxin system toxin component, PIN family [Formosimonas sp.]
MMRPIYILDTNIWLDWLVFDDTSLRGLKAAQASGEFEMIYTSDMLDELCDVVSRAQFALSAAQQEAVRDAVQALARCVPNLGKPSVSLRCVDADDQVFIDTALNYRATWLISKDKHVLRLKNRARAHNVRIGMVADWEKQR